MELTRFGGHYYACEKEFTILTQSIQYWVPRTHPPYPTEYRQQIVELATAGRSLIELAREFEPSEQTIRNWIKQTEIDVGKRHDGITTAERHPCRARQGREELTRLRRENKQLRLEREILSKAAAWFPCHPVTAYCRITTQFVSRCSLHVTVRYWAALCDPVRVFEFVKANRARYPIATTCRLLGVSTSGFHAWLKRGPAQRTRQDARLTERIRAVHTRSRGTYGAPRIHAELRDEGVRVGGKRIARLMQAAGLRGWSYPDSVDRWLGHKK